MKDEVKDVDVEPVGKNLDPNEMEEDTEYSLADANQRKPAWCDICKKNLCSEKYKIEHMMKKHGIGGSFTSTRMATPRKRGRPKIAKIELDDEEAQDEDGYPDVNVESGIAEELCESRRIGTGCLFKNCLFSSPDFPSLAEHLRTIHPGGEIWTLHCEICSGKFRNKSLIVRHTFGQDCERNFDTSSKYKCADCPVSFFSFRNLESHVNLNHLGGNSIEKNLA